MFLLQHSWILAKQIPEDREESFISGTISQGPAHCEFCCLGRNSVKKLEDFWSFFLQSPTHQKCHKDFLYLTVSQPMFWFCTKFWAMILCFGICSQELFTLTSANLAFQTPQLPSATCLRCQCTQLHNLMHEQMSPVLHCVLAVQTLFWLNSLEASSSGSLGTALG